MKQLLLVITAISCFNVFVWSQTCGEGDYDAEAILNGSTWTVTNGGNTVYTGSDMLRAMQEAVGSLSRNRTRIERVLVKGDGTIQANRSLDLPSYTAIDVCGTINVTGPASGDNAVIRGRDVHDIEIENLSVTGAPYFGIFFRKGYNITLKKINLQLSGGLGIRIDNDPSGSGNWGSTNRVKNVRIDNVYVSGASNHGVETYGIDGLKIGKVTARNVANCGLILNSTINAEVDTIDGEDCATGTGYATFRMANRNGKVGNDWPENIFVHYVRARRGGRGIFSVSESGGAVFDKIDIAGTESNSILLENAYNVTLATVSGVVEGSDIRIAARADEFENSRDLTIQNLTLKNCNLNESPCGENVVFKNIQLEGRSRSNICSKIIDDPVSVRKMELNNKNISINSKLSGSILKMVLSPDAVMKTGAKSLQVVTAQGRIVLHDILKNNVTEYYTDLSSLPNGVYMVRYANQTNPVVLFR